MEKINRQHMTELEPDIRNKCFEEVCKGFDIEAAKKEASRCLNCKNAPCVTGCPVNVRINEFIQEINKGDLDKAAEIIMSTNNLPAICGRVCPQESQCESKCIRGKIDGAVSIGGLERFVADYYLSKEKTKIEINENGKKACIIGSGPSSLTCAALLRKAGFKVTVFEAFHKAGGVLVYGIPEFRLPKDLVQKEIDNLLNMGVELETNVVVGKTVDLMELVENYDAIFIGTGAGLPTFLNIPGENLVGVFSANEYLTRVNLMKAYKDDSETPIYKGKDVVVVGGGNVAMDAARTALRLGANVKILYRRSLDEMPARKEEVRHAMEEGIDFLCLSAPIEIIGENGKVVKMKCIKMELGEPDQSGRRRPVEIKGSEYELSCDTVISAVGTSPNPILKKSCDKLLTSGRGTIVVSEELETSIENVYAGGDAVTGAATVILAMGAGKKAAENIIKKLGV